jgi:hypothetical protein
MVKVVLVIECQPRINWYRMFADCKLHGTEDIQVTPLPLSTKIVVTNAMAQ